MNYLVHFFILFIISPWVFITAQVMDTLYANQCMEKGYKLFLLSEQKIKNKLDSAFTQTRLNKNLLDSSNYYYNIAARIYENNKIWHKYIDCVSKNAKNLTRSGQIDSAIAITRTGLNEIERNSPESIAEYYNYYFRLGSYFYRYKTDFDSAIKYLKRSINLGIKILPKTSKFISTYYTTLGDCYTMKRQFDSSLYFFNYIIDSLNSESHPIDFPIYEVYKKISKNYEIQGNFDLAVENMQKAIDLCSKIAEDSPSIEGFTNDLGNLYHSKGEYDKALECYFKSITFRLKHIDENNFNTTTIYSNIGSIYLDKGDYNKSLEYFNKCLYTRINSLGGSHSSLSRIYWNLSYNYYCLNDFQNALLNIQHAIDINKTFYAESDIRNLIFFRSVGLIFSKTHNFEKALIYINKCIDLINKNKNNIDVNIETAEMDKALGTYFTENLNFEKASEYLDSALILYTKSRGTHYPLIIKINNSLGDIYIKLGKFEKAVEYFNAALKSNNVSLSSIKKSTFEDNVISEYDYFESLKGKSYALKKWFNEKKDIDILDLSYKTNLLCIDLFNKLKYSYKSDLSKMFLTENFYDIFDLCVESALELGKLTDNNFWKETAFDIVEKSKNGLLQSALIETKAKKFAGVPDSILNLEDGLKRGIESYNILISRELDKSKPDSAKINLWQNRLFSVKEKFLTYINNLENNYPQYHKLKFKSHSISIHDVQKAIDTETTVIEYFLRKNSIIIFTISKNNYDITTVPIDSTFDDTIISLYKTLLKHGNLIQRKNHELFVKYSSSIYDLIINPIYSKISGSKSLVIIPDGKLFYIPFEVLMAAPKQYGKFSEYNYLLKEHEISYHYSSTLHFENDSIARKEYQNLFTGFAPMFVDSTVEKYLNTYRKSADKFIDGENDTRYANSGNLIFAKQEVISIDKLFNQKRKTSRIYLDISANESHFKEIVSKSYTKYLHIATHGIANETRPNLSALLFSQPTNSSKDDGTLFAEEILNMQINSELVVLSACESGIGKLVKGEGMMALNRNFLYSGVKNLLFSLWKVNDKETCKLMVEFYKNLLNGLPYRTALRNAKLNLLLSNELSSIPSNWSAFVLIGN